MTERTHETLWDVLVGVLLALVVAAWILILSGCATAPGTVLEKIVEPRHASLVHLSTDGQEWTPVAEGRSDEFYLVIEGRDKSGRPVKVRVLVEREAWDGAEVGRPYALREEK